MSMIINNTQTEIALIEHYTVQYLVRYNGSKLIDHSIKHSDIIWLEQQFKPTIKQCLQKVLTFQLYAQ